MITVDLSDADVELLAAALAIYQDIEEENGRSDDARQARELNDRLQEAAPSPKPDREKPVTAILEMEGGLIQCADVPEGFCVEVRDYDIEGLSAEELAERTQVDSYGNRYFLNIYCAEDGQ